MPITSVDITPYYGFLRVSGAEAATFLQGQLTCDIQTLSSSEFQLGGHCNLKGRLRALFRIFKQEESFYLQTPRPLLEFAAKELKKYAKFSKVVINQADNFTKIIGLIGIEDLRSFLAQYHLNYNSNLSNMGDLQIQVVKVPEINLPHSHTRYQIIGSETALANFLTLLPTISKVENFEFWKLADIQAGLPEVWPELSEQLLPHHINLPKLGGVSFTKGCYCGQEIVARMEYRGNIKKRMLRGKIKGIESIGRGGEILPDTRLYIKNNNNSEEEIGLVITAAITEDHYTEMLLEISEAFIPKNSTENEIMVHLDSIKNISCKLNLSPTL